MLQRMKKNPWLFLSAIAIFGVTFFFFRYYHTLTAFNGDDWRYIGTSRWSFYPQPYAWNPSRILPELLMPLTGWIGSFFLMPLGLDYLSAITCASAGMMAIFITIFYISFFRFLNVLCANKKIVTMLSLTVITLFFSLFKSQVDSNPYMLYSYSLCTYFYYTIPQLWCAAAICGYLRRVAMGQSLCVRWDGQSFFACAVLYFAIFSLEFPATFITCFLGLTSIYLYLQSTQKGKKKKTGLLRHLKGYFVHTFKHCNLAYLAVALYILSVLVGMTGGRASNTNPDINQRFFGSLFSYEFLIRIKEAATGLIFLFKQLNRTLVFLLSLPIFGAGVLMLRNRRKRTDLTIMKLAGLLIACGIALAVSFVLLGAYGGSYLSGRIDSVFGVFLFIIFVSVLCLVYVQKHMTLGNFYVPLLLTASLLIAVNTSHTLAFCKRANSNNRERETLMRAMIQQIIEADQAGAQTVTLDVPEEYTVHGWPFPSSYGTVLNDAMYRHHIIQKPMEIILNPVS